MRPRSVSHNDVVRAWRRLDRKTGRALADSLGVSERTAWRYLRVLGTAKRCPMCGGLGIIRKPFRQAAGGE